MINGGNRTFIVGCGRSGTTLLQAMLSAHDDVTSFPETQFFSNVVDQYEARVMGASLGLRLRLLYAIQSVYLYLGLAPRPISGLASMHKFIEKAGINSAVTTLGLKKYLLKYQVSELMRIMDVAAADRHKSTWLLKTPANVAYIDVIEKYVDNPMFIHILRPGKDVVASIYDAALKYPDTVWMSHFYRQNLQRISGMWNQSIRHSINHLNKPNHIAVSYKGLVANPVNELARVFKFIGLPDDPECSVRYAEQSSNIVSNHEKWKKGVTGSVKTENKYDLLFNSEQKSFIEQSLNDVDIESLAS